MKAQQRKKDLCGVAQATARKAVITVLMRKARFPNIKSIKPTVLLKEKQDFGWWTSSIDVFLFRPGPSSWRSSKVPPTPGF